MQDPVSAYPRFRQHDHPLGGVVPLPDPESPVAWSIDQERDERLPVSHTLEEVRAEEEFSRKLLLRQSTWALEAEVENLSLELAALATHPELEGDEGYDYWVFLRKERVRYLRDLISERRQAPAGTPFADRRFQKDWLERLKFQCPLHEFVVDVYHVPLKRSGNGYIGRCPMHDDGSPSLHVWDDHFYCFGCSTGGDIFAWVRFTGDGIVFPQQVELVANWAHLPLPEPVPYEVVTPAEKPVWLMHR